jgi:hypothetical protein
MEELHNLFSALNIITLIKLRRMNWVEHVTDMLKMRRIYENVIRKPERRNHSEDLDITGRIMAFFTVIV